MAAKSERSGHTFNRFLQARLPLPLARLYARAANAVSARNRLLSAYYLHEATLKLATSIEVMRYLDRPWRNKSVDRMLGHLALPSVGVWSSLLPVLAKEDGERSGPGAALCMEFTSRPLIGAMQVLSLGRATASGKVSAMQIYEHLPTFRASLITAKEASEPAGAASRAEVLLDAFVEILDETSILDHFSFAFLESVDVTEEGTELRWFDLTGPTPVRAAAEIVEGDPGLVEGGTYAQLADGSRLALQPLLLFREDEILPEMLFLDGTDPKRNCFYLEYATGKVEDPNVLINVVSRRVKQLKSGFKPLVESLERLDPEDIALREVIEGKIQFEVEAEEQA